LFYSLGQERKEFGEVVLALDLNQSTHETRLHLSNLVVVVASPHRVLEAEHLYLVNKTFEQGISDSGSAPKDDIHPHTRLFATDLTLH
jgi:hypothetical protein